MGSVLRPRRLAGSTGSGATKGLALAVSLGLVLGFGPCNLRRSVEVANLNLLHGFDCDPPVPGDGDQCRVADRVELLLDHIVDSGCPDVVTLQENVVNEFVQTSATETRGPLESTVALIEAGLPSLAQACGFPYQVIFDPTGAIAAGPPRGVDEELILTRYPAVSVSETPLYSALAPFFGRQVLHARIDHPVGLIDVYTTHLASGADAGSAPCGAQILLPTACPAECEAFVDTVRECQAKQLALLVEATHDVPGPAFVTGDFNDEPDTPVYAEMVSRGWLDSHLAAGNPECDPASGDGCTTGRDEVAGELEDPALNVDRRIDYIFVVPGDGDSTCGSFEFVRRPHPHFRFADTGIFAGEPNPFVASCGPEPDDICWTSDHSGNQANLQCRGRRRG